MVYGAWPGFVLRMWDCGTTYRGWRGLRPLAAAVVCAFLAVVCEISLWLLLSCVHSLLAGGHTCLQGTFKCCTTESGENCSIGMGMLSRVASFLTDTQPYISLVTDMVVGLLLAAIVFGINFCIFL